MTTPTDGMVTAQQLLDPNKDLMMRARELLEESAELVEKWASRQCDQVQGYTEQNQAMLLILALERQGKRFKFTRLHTFKGWLNEGRCVRNGEKAYVISGAITKQVIDGETGEPKKGDDGKQQRALKLFRWLNLFDESQTDVLEPKG